MGSRKNLVIGILAALFLAAIFLLSQFSKPQVGELERDSPRAKQAVLLPEGSQTFQVVSADGVWPKFVEATIDPLDVKPGQIQKMRVVLNDDVEITEVVAEIETDKGMNKVPLRRTGQSAVSQADLLQKKYFIKDGRLILLDGKNNKEVALTKSAEAASLQKFVYEGQWLVRDTHEKTYQTVFVAKDASGRSERLVMAWTDPCTPPSSGDWVIGSSQTCGTGATEGAEGGNVSFSSATCGGVNPKCTLTVLSGATLAWNPGYSISLFGGGVPTGILVLESGAGLKQGYLCVQDADSDGYYPNATVSVGQTSTCADVGATYGRRLTLGAGDCYDANASAKPGQTAYFTANRGDGSFDYNCDGVETKSPSLVVDSCTITGLGNAKCDVPSSSCDENSSPNTTACGSSLLVRRCNPINCTPPDEGWTCPLEGDTTSCL